MLRTILLYGLFLTLLTGCGRDKAIPDHPRLGKTFILPAPILLVSHFENSCLANSPTENEVGLIGIDLPLTSINGDCAPAARLEKILPAGTPVKIDSAYVSIPPWYAFDSSSVNHLVLSDPQATRFVVMEYVLNGEQLRNENRDKIFEDWLAGYKSSSEMKSWYIQPQKFWLKNMYGIEGPACSQAVFNKIYGQFLLQLKSYGASNIEPQLLNCAFSVNLDQMGFGYALLRHGGLMMDISSFEKVN